MIRPEIPKDEAKRLGALMEYSLLDTLPEKEYDEITFIASLICKTPISLISLIDDKRQWFKSHHGLNATETPKEYAFCAHAINNKNKVLIVTDSRKDERFHDNPLVTDDPHVIFYAGVPLVTSDGYPLGTLCVIDNKPNQIDEIQIKALKALSNQLVRLFDLRKKTRILETTIYELETQNIGLEKFASVAAHDIKSPLSSIMMMTELFENQYSGQMDPEGIELLKMISDSSNKLIQLIEGILKYSKNARLLSENEEQLNLNKIIAGLFPLFNAASNIKFHIIPEKEVIFYTNKTVLEQIFINLIANSIKYNDKDHTEISIYLEDYKGFVKINFIDNGPGIRNEDKERIFQIFETSSKTDRFGDKGNGIGLATVKALVEGLGGNISLISEFGKGSNFEFTIKK